MRMKDYSQEKIRFLSALGKGYTVAAAAKEADIGRRTVYDIRDREPAFRDEWDYAMKEYQENLLGEAEAELKFRAFDRQDNKSHIMLIFLMKKLDPTYKENYKNESKIIHETVHEVSFNQDELNEAIDILTAAKTRVSPVDQE